MVVPRRAVLTDPQRELVLWMYKRRNAATFSDMIEEFKPAKEIYLRKCLDSLVPTHAEQRGSVKGEPAYLLTDYARDLAGNIKAALEAAAEDLKRRGRQLAEAAR